MAILDPMTPANAEMTPAPTLQQQSEQLPKAQTPEDRMREIEKEILGGADPDEHIILERAKTNWKLASDNRRRYDWEWLSRDLFRRGYQFTRYNPTTRTVTMAATNNARIPINLTVSAMRVIKNQVTAFKPKWEVLPTTLDEESHQNARYSGKTLDYIFVKNKLRKTIKETVMQGLIYSVGGPWQIGWDTDIVNEDNSKGFVYIWLVDPYDFYFDPNCTDGLTFSDAQFCIKAVRRSLSEVRNNQNYKNRELLTRGDMRVAASEYKQFLLQSLKYMGQMQTTIESETVIVKEGYFKEHQEDGSTKIRQVTWVDSMIKPLQNELLDTEDFPFRMYQADINPLEVYGEGWARHTIPINKVINSLESSVFDYNYRYAKGRIVVDKNSGVRVIDNQHGSIVEKNRGTDVHSLPLQPLPQATENQIIRMRQYFEDLSGAHDVSLGRIPVGVKSGIGIAELKQADATNQDDLVDNLEDFLVEVAKKCLMVLSENINFPRIVKATNIAGKADYFAIIGEKFAEGRGSEVTIGAKKYPLAVITPNNTVTVQIGSWLAYSKQQRQQELKDLFTQGIIDQRTLLEHLEFGDVDTILARTRQEAILKARRNQQQVSQTSVSEEALATTENDMMLMGDERIMAQGQDDHEVHISVHSEHKDNAMILAHIQEHYALLGREMQPESPLTPEQPQLPEGQTATPPAGGTGPATPPMGGEMPTMPEVAPEVAQGVPTGV